MLMLDIYFLMKDDEFILA